MKQKTSLSYSHSKEVHLFLNGLESMAGGLSSLIVQSMEKTFIQISNQASYFSYAQKGEEIRCNYSQAMATFFLSERNLCIADLYKTSILISYTGTVFIYIVMVRNKSQHQIKLCPRAGGQHKLLRDERRT